jgi:3-dehydroquinate synthase
MIYDRLTQEKFTRSDVIVALGGGVTGDMAGFAAGSYLRGIGFVQMPTTLLSMVDSAVGGKVAVNLSGGKNLVGMFYQPKVVLCNPNVLKTLPPRVFYDGMAEVIKHALIQDESLYAHLLDTSYVTDHTEDLIYRNCAIKSKIVLADEYDVGQRMMLNFGHTIGHAVEKYYRYGRYTHGEAVAIGMAAIVKIGYRLGVTPKHCMDAVIAVLKRYHLPYALNQNITDELGDAVSNDKKNFGVQLTIVLLKDIGQAILYQMKTQDFIDLFYRELKYEQR